MANTKYTDLSNLTPGGDALTAEASDLGITVGEWPTEIRCTLSGALVRTYTRVCAMRDGEGELTAMRYANLASPGSRPLIVFND